jgi:hypothetical protein
MVGKDHQLFIYKFADELNVISETDGLFFVKRVLLEKTVVTDDKTWIFQYDPETKC